MRIVTGVLALISALFLHSVASAQRISGIAGVVRDTSGGVLPGVTAEAASPALIESPHSCHRQRRSITSSTCARAPMWSRSRCRASRR